MLVEAGLADRVRVGAPGPPPEAAPSSRTHRTPEERQTPGAEEAFSPDVLLRPTSRAEGRLIELGGERSSGATALAYRMAALASSRSELVGWVDLPNALDPRYLQRAGVRLADVLWARPPGLQAALRTAELLIKTGFALVVLDLEGTPARELARLPVSVWTRLARAVREGRATALLLGTQGAAGTHAALGARAERSRALFDAGLFEGLESRLEVVRLRTAPPPADLHFAVFQRP